MNRGKNYTTIHLRLNQINVLEDVILLIAYLIQHVFQLKQNSKIHAFNLITGKNESKILTKDISCKCKCNFDGRKCASEKMVE